jgi:hypothetical protein
MPGKVLAELHDLWLTRGKKDEYIGNLVNARLADGGVGDRSPDGESYFDVGTMDSYLETMRILSAARRQAQYPRSISDERPSGISRWPQEFSSRAGMCRGLVFRVCGLGGR